MGNSRSFTSKFVANKEAFERIVRKGCSSMSKRKAAIERAIALPNRLPEGPRASLKKGKEVGGVRG